MISSNKPVEPQNALMRRVQRYGQSSTIFRTKDSGESVTGSRVQRSATSPTKATLLSQPSTLPVGRTIDADGIGSMPVESSSFPVNLPETAVSTDDSLSVAINQVTQLQRMPERTEGRRQEAQVVSPKQPAVEPTPVETPNIVQATPKPESETNSGDWGRLQRIFKGHETKTETPSEPVATPPKPIQRAEDAGETAVFPSQPSPPSEAIQRAVHTAESTSTPTTPKKAPLESIWPVQQVEKAANSNDEPIVMQQPDTPVSTEPAQPPAEAETIRRKLGDVSSTQRTDSSIELHLPRRPRPSPIQAKAEPQDADKAFWDRMRKVEGKPPETVQPTVDTDIGPLPADMWEFLGETPPGNVTETPTTGGEPSAPNVQMKPADTATPFSDPEKETSDIPSFLAEATTTAPNTPDTIQRAIAAAEESPTIQEKLEATPSPTPIQRKESTVSEPQPATNSPIKSEDLRQTDEAHSPISVEPVAESTIQRSTEITDTPTIEPTQSVEAPAESASRPAEPVSHTPIEATSAPTATQSASVQRAIVAAETPTPTPTPTETSVPSPTKPAPIEIVDSSVENPIQPKRIESTQPSKPMMKAVLPEPISPDSSDVANDTIQRTTDAPSVTPRTAVDLNADTAPLPALPDMDMDTPETAVAPPSSSPNLSPDVSRLTPDDAIQRAISAAESPSSQPDPSHTKAKTAQPMTDESPSTSVIQRTPSTPTPTLSDSPIQDQSTTPQTDKTAVPPYTPPAQDTIQRAITAAESAPSSPPKSSVQNEPRAPINEPTITETGVPTPSTQSASDTIQRAIAAAESGPSTPPEPAVQNEPHSPIDEPTITETAVPTPDTPTTPSTPDTIQRAIAAAETAPSTSPESLAQNEPRPSADQPDLAQTAVPSQSPADIQTKKTTESTASPAKSSPPPSIDTTQSAIQRAIASAEMPPTTTLEPAIPPHSTPKNKMATKSAAASHKSQIQRAISTAEASLPPPNQPISATPTIQRTPSPTATQTAVAPTSTLAQDMVADGWQLKQAAPLVTPTTQPSENSLMRAIAIAESAPPEPTQETVQWPDIQTGIRSTSSAETDSIQRSTAEAPVIQRDEQESQAEGMDNEGNEEEDENSETIDVDKLANEVYSQLRKRLAIEWERGRGKR